MRRLLSFAVLVSVLVIPMSAASAQTTSTTAAPAVDPLTVTELCEDGVDVLRIENVHDYYITYSIYLDGSLFEEDYESYDGDVDDWTLPTGHSTYSITWYEEYVDDTVRDGPSGDLPICEQGTTTTIGEVETDIADTSSSGVVLVGLFGVGFLALAGITVRTRRHDR